MADAVDLVRAYLHVNGYFTVTEYPLLEPLPRGGQRAVTDLDVLAFRFPGAGPVMAPTDSGSPLVHALLEPDPALGRRRGESDMIVAEVKEGRAELNRATRDPRVLKAALVRFGCCEPREAGRVVQDLLRTGATRTGHGHHVRLLAFGSALPGDRPAGYAAISLEHVLSFLRAYLRDHWEVVRHAQILDPALGFLSLMEKAERGASP